MPPEKTCTGCEERLPVTAFGVDRAQKDGLATRCRTCKRAASEAYRRAHPEKVRDACRRSDAAHREQRKEYRARTRNHRAEYNRAWTQANPDKSAAKSKRWRERHPDKVREQNERYRQEHPDRVSVLKRAWEKNNPAAHRSQQQRRRERPQYRIEATVRARLHRELTGSRKGGRRTFDLLGYSSADLKAHIELLFVPGMSWENYGEWHIDHIVPLSSFSYSTPEEPAFKAAWALKNLQPLWAADNLKKHAKVLQPTPQSEAA
jgi:hypothetical protein